MLTIKIGIFGDFIEALSDCHSGRETYACHYGDEQSDDAEA